MNSKITSASLVKLLTPLFSKIFIPVNRVVLVSLVSQTSTAQVNSYTTIQLPKLMAVELISRKLWSRLEAITFHPTPRPATIKEEVKVDLAKWPPLRVNSK